MSYIQPQLIISVFVQWSTKNCVAVKKAEDRENINSKSSTKGLEQAALCLPDVNEIYIK